MSNVRFDNVDDFIKSQPEQSRPYLERMRQIIHEVVPETIEGISYGIAAFTLKEGSKRDAKIWIAGYQKHVGFYPHLVTIEHFKAELRKYKTGKGSVQFPLDQLLPEKLIKGMVQYIKESVNQHAK